MLVAQSLLKEVLPLHLNLYTQWKDGTSRPKLFSATHHPIHAMSTIKSTIELTCFSIAVKSPEWRAAMALEFDAFQ